MLEPPRFVDECREVAGRFLREYGFQFHGSHMEEDLGADCIFSHQSRYVRFEYSCHGRDGPLHVAMRVGDGNSRGSEADWNSIRFFNLSRNKEGVPRAPDIYRVSEEDLSEVLERACHDLRRFGQDFLANDLTRFIKLRAMVNRDRPPEVLHQPDEHGRLRAKPIESSQRLKEKFS